jgi:hypothetical protein
VSRQIIETAEAARSSLFDSPGMNDAYAKFSPSDPPAGAC